QALRWDNFKDGHLYIKQEKTGVMLAISETTKLECLDISLSDVLGQFKALNNGASHIVADEKT
ncbi:MAG: hypothetical protein ACMX3H_16395, partial [Sodalis sp. (in: enterobacteria)]